MPRRIIVVLAIGFFGQLLRGQTSGISALGSPFITNFSSENIPEAGKNWDIAQGNDGKMYFANDYGLVQFDGYHWQRIGQPNNQSELRSFAVDGDRIYIGGTSEIGYFERDSIGEFYYQELNPLLQDSSFIFNDVRDIAIFKGIVFFLTDNGMMQYDRNHIAIVQEGISFQASAFGIDEIIFAGNDAGLFRFDGEHLQHINPGDQFQDVQIKFILTIRPETYLIGTNKKGLLVYKNQQLNVWNNQNQAFFTSTHLTHGVILNKNQLLFGSLHKGLILTDYEGNILNLINENDGLLDHNTLSLYKDAIGNIWTAVDGSIAYVELNSPFTILNKKHGLRGEIYCLMLHNGQLYAGTSRGLYVANWSNRKGKDIEFRLIPKTAGQCWQLFQHQTELLLAHNSGIYHIKGDRAAFIGGEGHWNFAAIPDHPNKLLTGHYTGISILEKVQGNYVLGEPIKNFSETAREIHLKNNTLWVSHGYKGIYQLELSADLQYIEKTRLYDKQQGLPSNLYNNLIPLPDQLLFGTQNGVYQYDPGTDLMEANPLFNGILDTTTLTRKLYSGPNGKFLAIQNYYRTDETLLIEILEDGSSTIQKTPFQKLKGQLIPAFESVLFLNDQQILFGGKQGLIIYDATFGQLSPKEHQCWIDQISLGKSDQILFKGYPMQQANTRQLIPIKPSETLQFQYSSSFFEAIPYMMYASYLEGYDEVWQNWTDDNQRSFNNLPEGDYTFWVKAKNIYDVEGLSSAYSFRIKEQGKDFMNWSNWPVLLLFSLITIGLLLLIWHQLSRPAERIRVLQRELQQKQSKIEHHKSKKAEWKREKEQMNQKLSHSLLRNEIYTGLIQKMEQLSQKNVSAKELEKTLQEFQDNLKGVELEMTARQQLETDDFLSKIKAAHPTLTPRELRLCSYLRLNISSKEIAEYLGISIRGVESLRYRLRKKLALSKEQDLTDFILKY